jgi:hypothetical protein
MSVSSEQRAVISIPLIALGVCLNTLGIVFQNLGWPRYVLMGAGLSIMLIGVVKLLSARE